MTEEGAFVSVIGPSAGSGVRAPHRAVSLDHLVGAGEQ
jgi:hypothetical protein